MRLLKDVANSLRYDSLARAGTALIILPLFGLLALSLHFDSINWRPLHEPISLHPGRVEQAFTVNHTGRYFVGIEFQTDVLSEGDIACLIGPSAISPRPHCPDKPVLNLNWSLFRRGKLITSGGDRDDIGSATTSSSLLARLGYFDAKAGDNYDVLLNIGSNASELDITRPALYVNGSPGELETALVSEALAQLATVILTILGLILLISGVVQYRGTLWEQR